MIVSRIHLQLFLAFICSEILLHVVTDASSTDKRERNKRELPLNTNCDPREPGSCFKGDLIDKKVANCERDVLRWWAFFSWCKPINDLLLSSVVDVADKSKRLDCVPIMTGGFGCGDSRTHNDTRCVCDKPVDIKRLQLPQCRCQYWPEHDVRENQSSFCTQYDHGGISGLHSYTCCNNCNDDNDIQSNLCDSHTYHGGGSPYDYCGKCGTNEGGGRATYRFTANSCDKLQKCEEICNRSKISNIPGFCFRWSGCFRKCISGRNRNKGNTDSEEIGNFCGDLMCQNGENHENCPFDCCPIHNPTNCSLSCNINGASGCNCPPRCCEESHCCNVAQSSLGLDPLPTASSMFPSSTSTFSTPTSSKLTSSTPTSSKPTPSTPTSSTPISSTSTYSTPTSSTPTSSKPTSSKPTSSTSTSSTPTFSTLTSSKSTSSKPTSSTPTSSTPISSTSTSSTPTSFTPTSSTPTSSTPTSSKPTSSTPTSSKPTSSTSTSSKPTSSTSTSSTPTSSKPTSSTSTSSKPTSSTFTSSKPTSSKPTSSTSTSSKPTSSAPTISGSGPLLPNL